MEDLNIHTDSSSKAIDVAEEIQKATTSVSGFDPRQLPGFEETAAVSTTADTFDIAAAAEASKDVDAEKTAGLKSELAGCGRDLRSAKKQETKSRENYYRALARAHLAGTTAFNASEVLVALAKKKKIPTTKATWKSPHLILLKLIDPKLDDKTASMCARALNYVAAAGVPSDKVADFLGQHGVVALAREEAKRQKLRKGGGAEKPPAEDPLEALRRERTPVPLPAEFNIEGIPENEGNIGLMIIGRSKGQVVGWAVDEDEKTIVATVRRVLKRTRATTPSRQEDDAEED